MEIKLTEQSKGFLSYYAACNRVKLEEEAKQKGSGLGIINLETGEIRRVGEGETIYKRKVKKTSEKSKDEFWFWNRNKEFIRLWDCVIPSLVKIKLSGIEFNVLLYLAQFVDFESCVVIRNDNHITTDDIEADLEISGKSVKNAVNHLKQIGLISTFNYGRKYDGFIINPFVFARGRQCNATLRDVFAKVPNYERLYSNYYRSYMKETNGKIVFPERANFVKIWKCVFPHILDKRLTGGELAVLFACIGRIRFFSGNVAQRNGKQITVNDLVEFTGLNKRTVKDAITKLVQIDFIHVDEDSITVSPFLATKGDKADKESFDEFKGL